MNEVRLDGLNEVSGAVIGAAIDVHRELGPGLLESVYESCLACEMTARGLAFQRQMSVPITYKTVRIDPGLRIDFLVENEVVVELKAIEKFEKIHEAQLLTYLRLTKKSLGLLISFNVPVLKDGIKRMRT